LATNYSAGWNFVSVPFTSGSSLQLIPLRVHILIQMFQFPLHRDPRCNLARIMSRRNSSMFQFPLHRDPRCNSFTKPCPCFLYRFSSLYIGILAATIKVGSIHIFNASFSSLYIGILAATRLSYIVPRVYIVSVPFTSGSSLQQRTVTASALIRVFQFPLHRDPRCNYPETRPLRC